MCGSNIKVFLPLPGNSIRLIHSPPSALSQPGLLSARRVDSGACSVAAAAEIGGLRQSRSEGAAARAARSLGNRLPGERAGREYRRSVGTFWDAGA